MSYARTHSLGFAATTATAEVIDNLALFGHTPHDDEPEYRPFPEDSVLQDLTTSLFASVAAAFADTALAPESDSVMWSLANLFDHQADRIQRQLDDNESAQRTAQAEQDGSEIRSVELERLIENGQLLVQKRDAFETMRDAAALAYEDTTGSVWRPRKRSMVSHRNLTAAMIDSREYIAAKRRTELEPLTPKGQKVAFAGGLNFNDHTQVYAVLDELHGKIPDMVLVHGGNQRGAERIATTWASARKVPLIAVKPDWDRHQKAAPFKRNDAILDMVPACVVIFPGNGITDNLADKARTMRLTIKDLRPKRS